MNPKSTWLWLLIAAGLFGLIVLHEHFAPKPELGPRKVLPGFNPAAVTAIQVQPGKLTVRVERTNGTWRLTEPLAYPAQGVAINALLRELQDLTVSMRIPPHELKDLPKASAEYGFDPPQISLLIQQSNAPVRMWIGNKTAPGDQVFVQVIGAEGLSVVSADLLNLLPRDANDWRETTFVKLGNITFDRLDATNAGKALELERNLTNQSWRMIHPDEARADNERIGQAMRQLGDLQVREFVSDDPKADLDAFGLQTPELTLAFKQGTNTALLLEFGKSPTNQPDLAYARIDDEKTIVKVSKELFQPWLALHSHDFRDFMDRHLVVLPKSPDAIEIHSPTDDFTLQHQTNGTWRVENQSFPLEPDFVQKFLNEVQDVQATHIVKDAVIDQSWPDYGLAAPLLRYIFKNSSTNADGALTNVSVAELDFGIKETNVFARRIDEPVVYAVAWTNFQRLPSKSIEFRERRIWKFSVNDVIRLTAEKNGTTLELLHLTTNKWKLGAGSQGMVNDLAIEEVASRLGDLSAAYWVQRGDINSAQYGFTPESLRISIELKGNSNEPKETRKLNIEFGGTAASGFPFAMTVLDGEPWIFEFPWGLYQYIDLYLNPARQTSLTHGAPQ